MVAERLPANEPDPGVVQRIVIFSPTAEVEAHQFVTRYTEGYSHFVTSMIAPVASGWSDSCRAGLAPTEERRLSTAHTHNGHQTRS